MAKSASKTRFTCEQVYNLWFSEPDIIQVIDLRLRDEFERGHIPGAVLATLDEAEPMLHRIGDKLAVFVVAEDQQDAVFDRVRHLDNFVFLEHCQRWAELNLPVSGKLPPLSQPMSKGSETDMRDEVIFHQIFEPETSAYTYIIADRKTKEAAIIDPVLKTVDRDLKLMDEMGLKLIYALDTNIHADHVTGSGELRKRVRVKTGVSLNAAVACVDIPLEDGQELLLGDKKIKVIATPGPTNTCLSFLFEGMLFTGDAILIRGCGRMDLQDGNAEALYRNVHDRLFKLPDETVVYPGHDYRGLTSSTIGAERRHAFGRAEDARELHPQTVDGIPEISVEDLHEFLENTTGRKVRLIDVRRPDEFNNELGHIAGAKLITLGPELTDFLERGDRSEEIVFICRSGGRSGAATAESVRLGYKFTINMVGGMLRWNEMRLPIERN